VPGGGLDFLLFVGANALKIYFSTVSHRRACGIVFDQLFQTLFKNIVLSASFHFSYQARHWYCSRVLHTPGLLLFVNLSYHSALEACSVSASTSACMGNRDLVKYSRFLWCADVLVIADMPFLLLLMSIRDFQRWTASAVQTVVWRGHNLARLIIFGTRSARFEPERSWSVCQRFAWFNHMPGGIYRYDILTTENPDFALSERYGAW